jgi:hypothetical protein
MRKIFCWTAAFLCLCGDVVAQYNPWADPKPRSAKASSTQKYNPWEDKKPRSTRASSTEKYNPWKDKKPRPPQKSAINTITTPQPPPLDIPIPINKIPQPKPASPNLYAMPLRQIKRTKPAPVRKEPINEFPKYDVRKPAPVPLQPPQEVENPSKNSIRLFNSPQNYTAYDWLHKIHLGFAFSLVAFDYRIVSNKSAIGGAYPTTYVNLGSMRPAFGVHGLMDVHINQFFSFRLQAGFAMGNRDLVFFGTEDSTATRTISLEAIMIEMPLLLKYKAMRTSNIRPYIITGLTPTLNVAALGKFNEEKGILLAVNPFDLHFNIGVGLDFYMNNFKIGIEIKYTTGIINNILKDALVGYERYPLAIDRAFAHTFVLSLLFDG